MSTNVSTIDCNRKFTLKLQFHLFSMRLTPSVSDPRRIQITKSLITPLSDVPVL